ncbi:MAG: DUF58 domain-containing protein [Myxococcota bacterium]|nr:DUF58 domain-containing protein [Myxococcota bacterium]
MLRRYWRQFWDRAPRQLKIEREGRILVLIALGAGLAAINTGNNLLFLAWGMVLSAIVLSGLLSEWTLRILEIETEPPSLGRVGEVVPIVSQVRNVARFSPAFAVGLSQFVRDGDAQSRVPGPFRLRIEPSEVSELFSHFEPERRGLYVIDYTAAHTTYPFGFFEKTRRFGRGAPASFWVGPKRVPVRDISKALTSQLGYSPAKRPGRGEEFFSLRPYREGEDPRLIHWRSSARAGKWVVREQEASAGRRVVLVLDGILALTASKREDALAIFASVADQLLSAGLGVGISAPGIFLGPDLGGRQQTEIISRLARLDFDEPTPHAAVGPDTARVVLSCQPRSTTGGATTIDIFSLSTAEADA